MLRYIHLMAITMLSYTSGLVINENVVFHKTNEVYANNAQWTVTFVHDLRPYKTYVNKIKNDLDTTHEIINHMIDYYRRLNLTGYVYTFESLHEEVSMLNDTYRSVKINFDDYQSLKTSRNRGKRSVLPFIGQAMNFLFGTITETDLDNINRNIRDLAENQENIIHNLEQSLTVLNLTRVQVRENRRAIMDLIICVQKLDSKILKLKEMFQQRFKRLEQFVNTYFQFKLILDEIRQTSQNAVTYLENIKSELDMLSLNHLATSIISPTNLRNLLLTVKQQLPHSFMLPVDPLIDIWYYYNTLFCDTYLDKDKILIILTLPLLNNKDKFEIYKIHNLPLSIRNATVKAGKKINLIAKFDIESDALMINSDRTRYSLLTSEEYKACNNPYMKFCHIDKAIYQINLSKSCVIALFMKHTDNVKRYCVSVVHVDAMLPVAKVIHSGMWIVSTSEQLKFTTNCQNTNKQDEITVNYPFGVIKLNMTCRASNNYLSLTPYYEKEITFQIPDPMEPILKLRNISKFTLWDEFSETFPNLTVLEIPEELIKLKQIPMTSFMKYIHHYRKVNVEKQSVSGWTYFMIILSILFVISLIAICIYKRFNCKKRLACCYGDESVVLGSAKIEKSVSSGDDEVVSNLLGRQLTSTLTDREAPTFASLMEKARESEK